MRRLLTVILTTWLLFAFLQVSTSVATAEQIKKDHRVTMILNTKQLYQNGSMYLSASPHVVKNGVTYISMRALGDRLGFKISYDSATKKSVMEKGNNRLAITQTGNSYDFNGKSYIYKNDANPYVTQGTLMVPLRDLVTMFGIQPIPKLSENKVELVWTEWIEVGIQQPTLQASFETSKNEYKIGEPITYFDTSQANGSSIVTRKWTNNEVAFFEPGLKKVSLSITNSEGNQSTSTRTITIVDEVMYTKKEFHEWFTPIGEKLPVVRDEVLSYKTIPYKIEEKPFTLIRSNSPERIDHEGIYYEDQLIGDMRFLIHNQNIRPNPAKIYLIAKNEGDVAATVTINKLGIYGPDRYVSAAGKNSVANYLTSLQQKPVLGKVQVEPNTAKIIIPELSNRAVPTDNVLTMYTDIHTNQKLTFQVVVLDEKNDLFKTFPYLKGVNAVRDGKHTRGTFENGNRELIVSELIGTELARIIIGDGVNDPYVTGMDQMSVREETNFGNRGVLYQLTLEKVAPNTALTLNPRGGQYAGAFLVNDKLVMAPTNGILNNPNETVVLYRTGKKEEKVTIQFIPASGSNLPINLLTIPLKVVE